MLKIKTKRTLFSGARIITMIAIVLLTGGAYIMTLVAAPTVAPIISMKPINVNALPAPEKAENRVIIPKIGVNIAFNKGDAALDRGAQWRYPERGSPETGGNFIIAAHRFSIQPTPQGTIEKSPFYNIDKMTVGDKIVVDYQGTRYGYEIATVDTAAPDQVDIESPSETAKLTLYSCELGGSEAGRVVLTATPLGKVALVK
jgi:sortase A